mmetsp:Transcript_21978/g.40116  ORF Transcript_21978/g.40116 Transcript_21978/m.40116 type:complete len:369 (+) Transcript_21978:283-1389(+)
MAYRSMSEIPSTARHASVNSGESINVSVIKARAFSEYPEPTNRKVSRAKSVFVRTFGALKTGSLRGSIFTLILTALGPEQLLGAALLKINGLFLGLFGIFFGCFVAQYTLQIIAKAADEYRLYDYQALVEMLTSHKAALLLEISIILYEIGVLIGLQVILGELMPSIWSAFQIHVSKDISSKVSVVVLNFALMTPLSLLKKLTTLQYVSLFAIVGIVYVTVLSLIEYPFFYEENKFDGINYAHFSGNFLSSIPICILMYFGHSNICSVQGELAETSLKRITKVITRFVLSMLGIVFVLSFFSYMSTLNDTDDICILRHPADSLKGDWPMIIGRLFMSFSVIAAVPINVKPIRIAILNMFFRENPKPYV